MTRTSSLPHCSPPGTWVPKDRTQTFDTRFQPKQIALFRIVLAQSNSALLLSHRFWQTGQCGVNSNQIGSHSKAPVSVGFYVSGNAGESCYRRHGSPAFPFTRGGTLTRIEMKRVIAIAAIAISTASASTACTGPVIMGVCHGSTIGQQPINTGGYVRVAPNDYVKPNAYGMGTGMDQYGRPRSHNPLWNGQTPSIFQPGGLGNIWAGQ